MWDKNKSLSLLNLKKIRLYSIEPFNALRSEKKVPLSPTGFSWEVKLQKLWERDCLFKIGKGEYGIKGT